MCYIFRKLLHRQERFVSKLSALIVSLQEDTSNRQKKISKLRNLLKPDENHHLKKSGQLFFSLVS